MTMAERIKEELINRLIRDNGVTYITMKSTGDKVGIICMSDTPEEDATYVVQSKILKTIQVEHIDAMVDIIANYDKKAANEKAKSMQISA